MTTYHLLLALHLVLAVFAVGPLVHAATTAERGIRTGDGTATASASRLLRIYSYASVLVIASGIVLMYRSFGGAVSGEPRAYVDYLPTTGPGDEGVFYGGGSHHIGEFSQTWIWLSIVLWVVAVGVIHAVIVPTLDKATEKIKAEESAVTLTARVAATGGVVGLLFAAIIVLMAFRPGQ